MYSLVKLDENRQPTSTGDSGLMSEAFGYDENNNLHRAEDEPKVGYQIRVGSHYARTFEAQDWWQTSAVKNILFDEYESLENADCRTVIFETHSGSIYRWRHFL